MLVAATFTLINADFKTVGASSATSSTYSLDSNGKLVATQDAYLPDKTFTELGINNPSDLTLDSNGYVYISDEGTKNDSGVYTTNPRVIVINSNGELLKEIQTVDYAIPNGLFIDNNDRLYVCYPKNNEIIMYNSFANDYSIINIFDENTFDSPLFIGEFNPSKIAVDTGGNMFVTSISESKGIIQLSNAGEFLGYFASNKVNLTIMQQIEKFFNSFKSDYIEDDYRAPAFSNVFADQDGLIYSTTPYNGSYDWVKKHNTSGLNQFTKYPLIATTNMEDIWVDKEKNVYSISQDGQIFVYTSQGEFIHKFGAGGTGSPDIAGVFKSASAIAVDENDIIWALDKENCLVQTFKPTDYATTIYEALSAYFRSDYDNSIRLWEEVLNLNQMSNLAHNNIGLNYLSIEEYELAMHHLKIANNQDSYSEAFWEVRNIWIQNNLTWIFILSAVLIVIAIVVSKLNKKYQFLTPVIEFKTKVLNQKQIKDYLFIFSITRDPENAYYDLRISRKGSMLGAWLIFITLFISYIIFIAGQGFIYQSSAVEQIDFVSIIFGFIAIIFTFVVCNYLVTSINEGNGTLGQIFQLLMYAMLPMIIAFLSITALSHVMTLSESFMLDVIMYVCAGYSIILVTLGMLEVHGYTFKEFAKAIFLTVLFMAIIVLVLLILFVLSQDLINFIQLIIQEVS